VVSDIISVPSLLSRLASGSDPVSQFLWTQFSAADKQALTDSSTPLAQKQATLVGALNMVLQSNSLYDEQRFTGVTLSTETRYLVTQNPQDEELARLNRLLLQDAYSFPTAPGNVPQSPEIRKVKSSINTTTVSRQMHPTIASDGAGRFLVVWSSYVGRTSFDLYGQRYTVTVGQVLPQPAAPFVSALGQYSLGVTWAELSGFPLSYYELYQDGSAAPTATITNNMWVASGLMPGSTHWFQWDFVLTGGQRSPLSAATTKTTWGIDATGKVGTPDGLPDDWQTRYFGTKPADWDGPNVDSDGDGATNWQEFLAGTDPRDPNSVLKMNMTSSAQGRRLSWTTVAGGVYQVQVTADFESWSNLGSPRLAAGTSDTIFSSGAQDVSYYRVIRVQ